MLSGFPLSATLIICTARERQKHSERRQTAHTTCSSEARVAAHSKFLRATSCCTVTPALPPTEEVALALVWGVAFVSSIAFFDFFVVAFRLGLVLLVVRAFFFGLSSSSVSLNSYSSALKTLKTVTTAHNKHTDHRRVPFSSPLLFSLLWEAKERMRAVFASRLSLKLHWNPGRQMASQADHWLRSLSFDQNQRVSASNQTIPLL